MLSYSFPPRQAPSTFRVIRFTRHLPSFGWRCVVVAPRAECCATRDDGLLSQIQPLTEVYRFACRDPREHLGKWMEQNTGAQGSARYTTVKALDRLFSMVCVPDSRVLGVSRLLRIAMKVIHDRRVDAIWLTGPPFGLFSIVPALKRRSGLPIVLDLRDPWTTSPIRYQGRNRWKRVLERRLERRQFTTADRVILNTQFALREYQAVYPEFEADKWAVLPNTFDPEDFADIRPERFSRCVLLHAGNSGGIRTAKWLFQAMGNLRRAGSINPGCFRYISYGPGGRDEHEAASLAGVTDMVEFRGARTHAEVLSAMSGADVLLLLVGEGHEASIPSKLYEYLAVERPILMAGPPSCAAADVIRETGMGEVVAHDDTDALASYLRRMLRGHRTGSQQDHQGVRAYQSRSVSAVLAGILDELVKARADAESLNGLRRTCGEEVQV